MRRILLVLAVAFAGPSQTLAADAGNDLFRTSFERGEPAVTGDARAQDSGAGVLQYGPDAKLYRLVGNSVGPSTLDAYSLQ